MATAPADTPRSARSQDQSAPLERFIREVVAPQHGELNVRSNVFGHSALMMGAARSLGIKIRKITRDHYVYVYKGEAIGGFDGRATTLSSDQARRVTQSLPLTRSYLRASGLPVPESTSFAPHQYDAALEHFRSQQGEVIVSSARKHSGFIARVGTASEEQFSRDWEAEVEAVSARSKNFQQILLTTTAPGIPLRVLTVGERAAAAVVRVPLYVVGDGNLTVGQLASREIKQRNECNYLAEIQPKVGEKFFQQLPVNSRKVLPPGTVQRLDSSVQGYGDGRISVDVTEQLAPEIAELALDAMWAVPGLSAAAVDLVVNSVDSLESAVLLSLSAAPDIAEFRYPAYGSAQHPNRAILRHLIEHSARGARKSR
ncbi:hypothetical protein [Nesterenkonia alkaliphila]|uniref:Uncharacterized protein n=1 Tax=Nesterenkonia alkaliphila TaxID=1463631 RepID=A0A7K1UJM2_9MICC|nr:hypothetical protein [Nesterenkonia alkaliphila]MVT26231.1 hypothetical protein [Nesterenkonia alkaliphila]